MKPLSEDLDVVRTNPNPEKPEPVLATYRVVSPVLALCFEGGKQLTCALPRGAMIKVDDKILFGDRLVEVVWSGKSVMMYTQDILSRGEMLEG